MFSPGISAFLIAWEAGGDLEGTFRLLLEMILIMRHYLETNKHKNVIPRASEKGMKMIGFTRFTVSAFFTPSVHRSRQKPISHIRIAIFSKKARRTLCKVVLTVSGTL
jgi:hypothetical protein